MRIEPSLSPIGTGASAPSGPAQGAAPVSFQNVLSRHVAALASARGSAAAAEPQYSSAPILDAPPKPPGLETGDAESRRSEMWGLLEKQPAECGPATNSLFQLLRSRLLEEQAMLAKAQRSGR